MHIVLTPGADKDTVIEEINGKLKSIYGSELVIKGYKVWDVALPSSGTKQNMILRRWQILRNIVEYNEHKR